MAEEAAKVEIGPQLSDERVYKDLVMNAEKYAGAFTVKKDKFDNDMLIVHDPRADEVSPNIRYHDALITDQGVFLFRPLGTSKVGYSDPAQCMKDQPDLYMEVFSSNNMKTTDRLKDSERREPDLFGSNTTFARVDVNNIEQRDLVKSMLEEAKRVADLPNQKSTRSSLTTDNI